MYLVVGLGNPGEEYKNTRHNVGRIILQKMCSFDWEKNKSANAYYCEDVVSKKSSVFLMPETFMNNSGKSVAYIKNKKDIETKNIIVIHDDLDLPFGKVKISFGSGSGGHNGIESIIKSIKTKDFIRIRIGISPVTAKGETKKPKGEERVLRFVMQNFKKDDLVALEKLSKNINKIIETIIEEGYLEAMNRFN